MVVVVLKHEKWCETKIVTRTPLSGVSSPNVHNRFHLKETLHGNSRKILSSWELLHKTAEICCSKTCANFGRCYGNQGWVAWRRLLLLLIFKEFNSQQSIGLP